MPISFKFKFANETRRTVFAEPPSWDTLSTRLQTVFGLPKANIAISYIDADNDEITVSTEDELQDYYLNYCRNVDHDVKLNVVDLASRRTGATTTPRVPVAPFEIDDEWQRLPSFNHGPELVLRHAESFPDSPHAFVEVVGSEEHDAAQNNFGVPSGSGTSDAASTFQVPLDEGKGKAPLESTGSSAQSILDDDAPDKHEIHVMSRSTSLDTPSQPPHSESKPADAPQEPTTERHEDPTDPPVPDLGSPTASLTEDIAALLGAFSSAVTMNPELAIHLRRITDNARRGTYWHAHREALSRSVNELSSSVGPITEEFRRNTEEEAARRISESLGGLFRTLSGVTGAPAVDGNEHPGHIPHPPFRGPWNAFPGLFAPPHPPHPPPPPPPGRGPFPPPPPPPRHGFMGPFPPPPPPPPHGFGGPFGPPPPPPHHHQPVPGEFPGEVPATDGIEGFPSAPPKGPSRFSGGSFKRASVGHASDANDIWSPSSRPSWLPPPPPPIQEHPSQSSEDSGQKGTRELRASVEAAKAVYKAEKEKYRKDRDERRRHREKEPKASGSGTDTAPVIKPSSSQEAPPVPAAPAIPTEERREVSTLVSNARGPYPRLEMVNIPPRRHHTVHAGHGHGLSVDDPHHRSYGRIMRKLSDMGFMESSHPQLPSRVKAKLSAHGVALLNKNEEDDIITVIMEEMLVPVPSLDRPADVGGSSRP